MLLPIHFFVIRTSAKASYLGIRLCDLNFDETDDPAFLSRTKEALDLIRETDSRRFRRIQEEIGYILNGELTSGAHYSRLFKICRVDFGRFKFAEYPDYSIRAYACTLVHEATHGAIHSHGIPYTGTNRSRIERLCNEERCRFARRLNDGKTDWAKQLAWEFDETGWHPYWYGSRWTQTRLLLKRVRESKAAGAAKRAEAEESRRITDERLRRIHQKMKQGVAKREESPEETQGG